MPSKSNVPSPMEDLILPETKLPASALITIKEIIKFAKLNQSLQQTVLTYINKNTIADRKN